MVKSDFSIGLAEFMRVIQSKPTWDKAFPDDLFSKINSYNDFVEFLKFASTVNDNDILELGCYETDLFLERLAGLLMI